MKITAVIPAYNEAAQIAAVVSGLKPYVNEIIVVDDASRDRTGAEALGAGALVLRHIINRDQGAALRTGTDFALRRGADIIIHFDADGQFLAEDIPSVIAPLLKGTADAVLGSRFMGKESKMPKSKRYLIMPLARFINRLFFNIRLSDPQSGFRALNRTAAEKIKIKSDGKAHCSEIIYQLFRQKLRVQEVPITVLYHHYGQKFSGGLTIIKDLIIQKLIQ